MMFKVEAITAQGEWRDFCVLDADLETIYTVLQTIVECGDTLIRVTSRDKWGCLPLPLDALEEPPFLNPIQALRQQWEEQLAQLVSGPLAESESTQHHQWLREHVQGLQACLLRFDSMRVCSQREYEQLLRLQDDPEMRSTIMEHYAVQMDRQWRATQTMKGLHQQALDKLSVLEAR